MDRVPLGTAAQSSTCTDIVERCKDADLEAGERETAREAEKERIKQSKIEDKIAKMHQREEHLKKQKEEKEEKKAAKRAREVQKTKEKKEASKRAPKLAKLIDNRESIHDAAEKKYGQKKKKKMYDTDKLYRWLVADEGETFQIVCECARNGVPHTDLTGSGPVCELKTIELNLRISTAVQKSGSATIFEGGEDILLPPPGYKCDSDDCEHRAQ